LPGDILGILDGDSQKDEEASHYANGEDERAAALRNVRSGFHLIEWW
jgi:hypothetical protein